MRKKSSTRHQAEDSAGRHHLLAALERLGITPYACDKRCSFRIGYTSKLIRLDQRPGRAKAVVLRDHLGIPVLSWDEPAPECAAA